MLSKGQINRYSRHIALKEIGEAGQQKLLDSRVLLVGVGGLGSAVAYYLAAAGIGVLGIVDPDQVKLSDLHRQIIYNTRDLKKLKVDSAYKKLKALNPDVRVVPYPKSLTAKNALDIIKDYDIVIDGTDNFPTRYLLNDACVLTGKPFIHASVLRFEGQVTVFNYDEGPCYRCLYPSPPSLETVPTCEEVGLLNGVPGIIGLVEATEAIKILLGKGVSLSGRLLLYNAWEMKFDEMEVRRDPGCPICSENSEISELKSDNYEKFNHRNKG